MFMIGGFETNIQRYRYNWTILVYYHMKIISIDFDINLK